MTDKLPPNLLQLFAPRPPLRWVEPVDYSPERRRTAPISSISKEILAELRKPDEENYTHTESWLETREKKKNEKIAAAKKVVEEAHQNFKPKEDPNIRGNPLSTMIVARLSYDADERDLERLFSRFGPIERIRLITNDHAHERPQKVRKPHKGYAFVVFEREADMKVAVRVCDGEKIKGRAIKTDVERGRTVRGWLPRRFGGGLGGRGYISLPQMRPVGPRGFGDGFRGGHRGFDGGRPRGGPRGGRSVGFRGDFGSRDRNSFGPPGGAPSGPGLDRRNGERRYAGIGFDTRGSGRFDDRHGGYRDSGRMGDRDADRRTGSNMEPIGRRDGGHRDCDRERDRGDRDRDRERDRDRGRDRRDLDRTPRDDDYRKRPYDGGGYEGSRKTPRY